MKNDFVTPECAARVLKFIPRMIELLQSSAGAIDEAIYTHIFDPSYDDEKDIESSHYHILARETYELLGEIQRELAGETSKASVDEQGEIPSSLSN